MRCREHGREASHVCMQRECSVKLLCDTCRLQHKYSHPTNAEEHPLSKVLEKCRHKLAGQIKQLEGAFHQFEAQETAIQGIQRCKQKLDVDMQLAIEKVKMFFSELKARLDLQNRELQYLIERESELAEVTNIKRRIMSMIYSLNTEEDLREAFNFNCEEVYQHLRNFNIKKIDHYWVYGEAFTPVVQIASPQLVSKPILGQTGSTYQPKSIPNDSLQHFIITEPHSESMEAEAAFFFDTQESSIRLYNIKLNSWQQYKYTLRALPEYGEGIYEPESRRYFYLGGSTSQGKSNSVLCFDATRKEWVEMAPMLRQRSSFGSCLLRTSEGNRIVVAGGLNDANLPMKECELYSTSGTGSTEIRPLNFAASNAAVCAFGREAAYKFGGLANGGGRQQLCPTIQRYNCSQGQWVFLNADIFFPQDLGETYRLFYANSRAIQINATEIFVFGGYSTDNQGTIESYILNVEEPEKGIRKNTKHTIRFWNQKPLPMPEGFSRTQPCLHHKNIYALQDVSHSDRLSLASQRTILRFDGYQWFTIEKVYV